MINWEKSFQKKNVHSTLKIFNEAPIFHNCILNKCINCNVENSSSLDDHIKTEDQILIKKSYIPLELLREAISRSKNSHYERFASKLNDPTTSSKTYWPIIKALVNGMKVLITPSIMIYNFHQFRPLKLPLE